MIEKFFASVLLFNVILCSDSSTLGASKKEQLHLIETLSSRLNQEFNTTNPFENDGKNCNRPCTLHQLPKICYYNWKLEYYPALGPACLDCRFGNKSQCFHPQCITADGIERGGVMSINRQVPGPSIHVCKNDIIVVDVDNMVDGASATIHWHGMHQRYFPFMDGVPLVTQCPILHGTIFRYIFHANESGTQFYHSHNGHHKFNGQYGVMVVRDPNDLNQDSYDFDLPEHSIYLADWSHEPAEVYVPGLQGRILGIDSLLINGRGRTIDPEDNEITKVPFAVFRVKKGGRYRFRLISGNSLVCPFQFQIEGHRMVIVSTDGAPVLPEPIDTLFSTAGERYDFVVEANQPKGNYWVRVTAAGLCRIDRKEQFAILSYEDKSVTDEEIAMTQAIPPEFDTIFPIGTSLNHPNTTCFQPGDDHMCVVDLQSHELHKDDELINGDPDERYIISFDRQLTDWNFLYSDDGYVHYETIVGLFNYIGITNNISMIYKPFPLLTQPDEIYNEDEMFCNTTHKPDHCKQGDICFCTHRLKVKLDAIVEIAFINSNPVIGQVAHPVHLHGHQFIVVTMGQFPQHINNWMAYKKTIDLQRTKFDIPENHNPPFKDTISIPSRGFSRVRFRATNPGFWLVHCHFEWHRGAGMSFVVQVGEIEDMVKPPKNFPKCGNFKMDVADLLDQE